MASHAETTVFHDSLGATSVVVLGVVNTGAWLTSTSAGTAATLITVIGLAVIGLATQAIQRLGPAWETYKLERAKRVIDLEAYREAAHAASLWATIEDLKRKLAERDADVERLNGMLKAATPPVIAVTADPRV